MPRPPGGTFTAEVWNAAKAGIVKTLSLGAVWLRSHSKGFKEIIGADLRDISLCSIGVNGLTLADAITPTAAKCVGGVWVADEFSSRWDAAVRDHQLKGLARDVAWIDLELSAAKARLGIRSR